jgi:hypothetical protein
LKRRGSSCPRTSFCPCRRFSFWPSTRFSVRSKATEEPGGGGSNQQSVGAPSLEARDGNGTPPLGTLVLIRPRSALGDGPLPESPGLQVSPEIHQEPPSDGHDSHPPHPARAVAVPFLEPPGEGALGLIAQPSPLHLTEAIRFSSSRRTSIRMTSPHRGLSSS